MYVTLITSVEELTACMNAVAETILQNPAMSERIQIRAYINREGRHFEQFL